jgi:hypothetical protein
MLVHEISILWAPTLDNQQKDGIIAILSSAWTIMQILIQCNLKGKISAYPCTWMELMFLYLVLLQSKKSYRKLPKIHSFMPYDAFNGYFAEQHVLLWWVYFIFPNEKEKGNKNLNLHKESQVILAYSWMSTNS